ncbi:LPXTG-site transpeptidase (sortase) family protein [Nocardioides albertanoniae]|uniref:LPXTG-site transpeptidase (Sortase) family protein n=1 Tax=Nocardioides albertanoniae TaxID=1175486 RepID=A0A543A427_9ACTN|nr:class F sortase [Nocardioides albertanoniae]TQL67340.1 LPXTG-site transpeptidase (sortase) family protein [Nocardioides albertanoniae]
MSYGYDHYEPPRRPRRQPSLRTLVGEVFVVVLVIAVAVLGYAAYDYYAKIGEAQQASAAPSGTTSSIPAEALAEVPKKKGKVRGVSIPTLNVHADVVPLSMESGTLTPPADSALMGWWKGGAKPGADAGSVLIVGHTLHNGGGVLNHLGEVGVGEKIVVRTKNDEFDYTVRSVRDLSKAQVAERSEMLFDPDGEARLVVVTCDDWDGTSFQGNTVVVATPEG